MLAKRDLLDDEETELVYQMIVNDDPEIRRAAAEVIDSVYIKSDLEKAFADEDNKADKTGFMLKGVVELLHQVNQRTSRLSQNFAVSDRPMHWCVRTRAQESIHASMHKYIHAYILARA
jgi:hypothetical protein